MENQSVQGGRILLVDDDINLVILLEKYLSSIGYDVIMARNGVSALQLLEEIEEPDLIISDVMMPEMDGYSFIQAVRENIRTNWIPIIFLSAKYQSQDRIKGLHAGADAYIVKPFSLEELFAQIQASMRASRLLQQNIARKSKAKVRVPDGVKLTQTELLVARLVAQGFSNQEIAQELNISKRTTESHISHMLRKTELSNRTELSRWIIQTGLD